jgi:N-acetylneuraminic acid mutarotase
MPTPRNEISACILDGKIYVIGGVDKNEYLTDTVEVYDSK